MFQFLGQRTSIVVHCWAFTGYANYKLSSSKSSLCYVIRIKQASSFILSSKCHFFGKKIILPDPLKGGCRSQGVRVYKLRAFRRETLIWINLLNKVSTPLSRSTMANSNTCNCSSWYASLVF